MKLKFTSSRIAVASFAKGAGLFLSKNLQAKPVTFH